jgi:hypothetical protein
VTGPRIDGRTKHLIYCEDFHDAARVAGAMDLHLSAWCWITDVNAPADPVVFTRNPNPTAAADTTLPA